MGKVGDGDGVNASYHDEFCLSQPVQAFTRTQLRHLTGQMRGRKHPDTSTTRHQHLSPDSDDEEEDVQVQASWSVYDKVVEEHMQAVQEV